MRRKNVHKVIEVGLLDVTHDRVRDSWLFVTFKSEPAVVLTRQQVQALVGAVLSELGDYAEGAAYER